MRGRHRGLAGAMREETSFLPPGPQPLIGADIQVVRPLGRVGDGLVYAILAGDQPARLREYCPLGVARRVADGTLHPADARFAEAWDEGLAAFLDQGRLLAGFVHPSVVPVSRVVDVDIQGVRQGAYLVGAPSGEPLAAALGGLALPPADVVRIGTELADVLAALHARGITHLDISPETVSISAGRVQLSDFAVDNRRYMALLETQEGFVRPGYSAIEHYDASGADPLGPPADIYAASALLYRLATGREPAPWQERWRDPAASELARRDGYPPEFIAAIQRGMAIEPGDRFPDGAAWRAAMGALRPTHTNVIVPQQVAGQASRKWLWPLLLLLGLLLIGGLAYLAYSQNWFVPAEQEKADTNIIRPIFPPIAPPPQENLPPEIRLGASVAGQLSTTDTRRPDGEFEDRFRLIGRAGDRIELRLSATAFDPVISMSGPGFDAANDDDPDSGRNSRLVVTLPRDGTYTISVSSYEPDATGGYLLEALTPEEKPVPPEESQVRTIDLSVATRLTGEWHGADDPTCRNPAVNSVSGDALTSRIGGTSYEHRIVNAGGDIVQTTVTAGPLAGRSFTFRLSPDGDSYEISGETWTRC